LTRSILKGLAAADFPHRGGTCHCPWPLTRDALRSLYFLLCRTVLYCNCRREYRTFTRNTALLYRWHVTAVR